METADEPLKEVPVRGDEMVRALRFEPNATPEMVELVSEALAIFDSVLVEPEMVLFVSVSVVARPTKVSVEVGRVKVPVLTIELMVGVVSVLLVSVCEATSVTTWSVPTLT